MRQNRNFNFKAVSSTNEKMLIVLSWIIVVIIVVLIGLYYGQQVREQEGAVTKITGSAASNVEVSANADSRIEEGELKISKDAGSVMTDSMTINKNEFFTVQIGSGVENEFYDESRADEIIKEFSDKNLYARKIMIKPDRKQYVVHIGLFKSYEDAKSMLNAAKLKNYAAKITITPDPNLEVAFMPKSSETVKKPADIVVATSDSKVLNTISQPVQPEKVETPLPEKPVTAVKPKAAEPAHAPEKETVKSPEIKIEVKKPAEAPIETVKVKEPEKKVVEAKNATEVKPVEKIEKKEETAAKIIEEETVQPVKKTAETKPAAVKKEPKKETVKPESKVKVTAADETADEISEPSDDEIVPDAEAAKTTKAAEKSKGKTGGYYIQLGTYKNQKNADSLKSKVVKLGMKASIIPGKASSGDTVYRVRLDGYATKNEAAAEAEKLKTEIPEVTSPYISSK
ncbi:MAG TPA: SPOR domain-containing protein [Candidatus Wallbacteria bacterium]|nr:SPOR domain-containing protein [Candidatus Wallbacteria bacterium]